jgi:hypothetical protein
LISAIRNASSKTPVTARKTRLPRKAASRLPRTPFGRARRHHGQTHDERRLDDVEEQRVCEIVAALEIEPEGGLRDVVVEGECRGAGEANHELERQCVRKACSAVAAFDPRVRENDPRHPA